MAELCTKAAESLGLAASTMAEPPAAQEPLLPAKEKPANHGGRRNVLPSLARLVLKSLMWLIFILWIAAIFFFPTEPLRSLLSKWIASTEHSVFGITGSIFLAFSGPVLAIAFLAFIYIIAFPRDHFEERRGKFPRFRLWTFPVIVDGPFGVVSAAEFIGILLFSIYVLWSIAVYLTEAYSFRSEFPFPSDSKLYFFLESLGFHFGSLGLFCLAFLFLPVARGSILLRLIDIPFEHATRYHVWLGHLTMAIFTLHGLIYVIAWALEGRLLQQILEWKDIGIANLPGVISLLAGLLMWVTSLHPVRKNYFELFFYTHQLYVIFVVFLALHVGDFVFSMAAAGIFLFLLDRFLRFCQSRTKVDILSAVCRPCGTVEISLSKPANLRYNALSFVFLQVSELSWLQWHPFSVSSSPMDGRYHLSILIKVLGEWTGKLSNLITSAQEERPQSSSDSKTNKITASIEGPYGHEVPYHLMYENLILVAGGIGISPFFAIISDICRRISEGKPCLPKNVLVIWAVKKSKELSLLSVLNEQGISLSCFDTLHLDVLSYVTQESEPPLEEGIVLEEMKPASLFSISGKKMSCLVGTGNNLWAGIYFLVSTFGFILLFGLVEKYYIVPFGIAAWWYRGLLFTLSMVASVVVLGGIVVLLWNQWEKKSSNAKWAEDDQKKVVVDEQENKNTPNNVNFTSLLSTQYGRRPDFHDIFSSFAKEKGSIDVGVIVCGPPSLQTSVAKECRSQNTRGRWNQPVFHFNSHSFDL